MKKIVLGSALILVLLGGSMGLLGWTAGQQSRLGTVRSTESVTDIAETGEQEVSEYSEPEYVESLSVDTQGEPGTAGTLAWSLLQDAETRTVYEEIRSACEEHRDIVELSTQDVDVVAAAYQAVGSDCGGMFWVDGYTCTTQSLGGRILSLYFSPSYTCTDAEREQYQTAVDESVEQYLRSLSASASDYEKVKYVYEVLACNVEYDMDSPQNQNILSVFLYGKSVCNGFASAAQYLLTLLDVPCITVSGSAEGDLHAWNLAYIDGEPYYFDATWGCALSEITGGCTYAYLNITGEELEKQHVIDMRFPLPDCTATDANYYVMQGMYFDAFNEARIGNLLYSCYSSGVQATEVKFATSEIYQQAKQTFITNMMIYEYCQNLTQIRYVENPEMQVLTLQWR